MSVAEFHIVVQYNLLLKTTPHIPDPTTYLSFLGQVVSYYTCLLYPSLRLWFYVALIIDIALVCLNAPASDLLTWASI